MQAYGCAGCHGFASSLMSMKFKAANAYQRMQAGIMPPGCQSHGAGCPTTDDIATFKAWLDAGMP